MARLLSTLLVVGLLGGTAAAFAVTEGLKLERSPITSTKVDKIISPVCGCRTAHAAIDFRLRKGDRVTVRIENDQGLVVRTLVAGKRAPRGPFAITWNGRDDAGNVLPQGSYKPRVHLAHAHRTIVLPNPIAIDTTPPTIRVLRPIQRVISPDGDHRHDQVRVHYRVDEPASAILYVNGVRRSLGRTKQLTAEARWTARRGGHGVPPGRYRISIAARDLAGNVSKPIPIGTVRVRYVVLAQRVLHARPGTKFHVRVLTDAPNVRWRLGKRSGVGKRNLVLRAPTKPGRYHLLVQVNRHAARALVVVERRP
ncbi:MAG TPA: FlgD immunoglobulin-like domain containing protein [Gaiellaceae bacterium]